MLLAVKGGSKSKLHDFFQEKPIFCLKKNGFFPIFPQLEGLKPPPEYVLVTKANYAFEASTYTRYGKKGNG